VRAAEGHQSSWQRFLILFGITAALYSVGLNSHWRFQRDSPVYLDAARALVEGRGYAYDGEPLVRYAPGFPLILAAIGKIAGLPETLNDSFLWLNLAISLLGLGCFLAMLLVLRELRAPQRVAFFALLFLAVSRTLYYYSAQIITDVPFTFFSLVAFWFGLKMVHTSGIRSWAWCAACAITIVWCSAIRPVGPLLALAVPSGLWLHRNWKDHWPARLGKTLVIWIVLVIPLILWSRWTHHAAPGASMDYTQHALNPRAFWLVLTGPIAKLPKHLEGISDLLFGMSMSGIPAVLALPFLVAGCITSLRRSERMLCAWVLLNLAAIIACGYGLGRRYLLPTLPVFIYWLVVGASTLRTWLPERWHFWTLKRIRQAGWLCVVLFMLPNMARISKVIYEARSPNFYEALHRGRTADYVAVTKWLRGNTDSDDVVMGEEVAILRYCTRRRIVPVPYDSRWKKAAPLPEVISKENVQYIATDSRHEEEHARVIHLMERFPQAVRLVYKSGRVQIIKVAPHFFSADDRREAERARAT